MTVDGLLQGRIRRLYDDTTSGWVDVWGEHLHHGDYGPDGHALKDPVQAQIDMVEALLEWGGLPGARPPARVLDAGCGVGGSARHLARKWGAEVQGLTLSPVQCRLAQDMTPSELNVHFAVQDTTQTTFPDESFDMVWALESAEHMPSKQGFLAECTRLLRPGGQLLMATWCHRPVPPELERGERRRLDRISWSYGDSLSWVSEADYRRAFEALPLVEVSVEDWSPRVGPFWNAVLRSVLTPKGGRALVRGGRSMWTGAFGGLEMRRSLRSGLVRYLVLKGVKGDCRS